MESVSVEPQATAVDRREPWYRRLESGQIFRTPVFLSYSTPNSEAQFEFATGVASCLRRLHLAPRTMGVNEYDYRAPLPKIRHILQESHGLLAIAFRKADIQRGTMVRRRGESAPVEVELADTAFTSPWVHIETAMAFQEGLPILILREEGVLADGLLEPGTSSQFTPEFSLTGDPLTLLRKRQFKEILSAWEHEVRVRAAHRPGA